MRHDLTSHVMMCLNMGLVKRSTGFKYCIAGGFFQKSIDVTPTPVKMAEHAKNKKALTNASVPRSFKEVTVRKVRIVKHLFYLCFNQWESVQCDSL